MLVEKVQALAGTAAPCRIVWMAAAANSFETLATGASCISRGFTWAESGYPMCQPDALFRLASVSKLFAAAAIQTIRQAQPFPQSLHFLNKHISHCSASPPSCCRGRPQTAASTQSRCVHLLEHQGGWQRSTATPSLHPSNPPASIRVQGLRCASSRATCRSTMFVSARDVARYMYGEPLQYTPGTTTLSAQERYSNFG